MELHRDSKSLQSLIPHKTTYHIVAAEHMTVVVSVVCDRLGRVSSTVSWVFPGKSDHMLCWS